MLTSMWVPIVLYSDNGPRRELVESISEEPYSTYINPLVNLTIEGQVWIDALTPCLVLLYGYLHSLSRFYS